MITVQKLHLTTEKHKTSKENWSWDVRRNPNIYHTVILKTLQEFEINIDDVTRKNSRLWTVNEKFNFGKTESFPCNVQKC